MNGIMVVVEGLDGSGKATQSRKLYERLKNENKKVVHFEFPNYNNDSAFLVKEYLAGEFGNDYKAVDPRVASMCYAIDRLITYRDEMKKYYEEGYIIICDRWTTANLLHQSMKLETKEKIDNALEWIETLEYEKFKLPKPNITFFLKVPYEYSFNTVKERYKEDGSIKNDIHEKSIEFLKLSYENGIYVSDKYNWNVIECYNEEMRSIDDIHEEIYNTLMDYIK